MHRFTIQRKICDTLMGATYECRFNVNAHHERQRVRARPTPTTRPRASIALKCSNLSNHKRLVAALAADDATATRVDDPQRERDVVAALIASSGHDHVLQCYDYFKTQDETTGDECICIVTEYCNGDDLFSYLSTRSSRDAKRLPMRHCAG